MKRLRLRAVVLAAGYGRRLRPLTESVPKPLLPIAGKPVAMWTLERLAAAGCEAACLNLHHLGDELRAALGDEVAGMRLAYSEEPELLGTLGALSRPVMRRFVADADLVVVVNGDTLCRWPVKRLVRRHLRSGARASLLVARRVPPEPYGGGIGLDEGGRVVDLRPPRGGGGGESERRVFAGAHVFPPGLVADLPEEPADFVTDLYEPLLAAGGELAAVTTLGRWHDLGTPARYLEAARHWIRWPWPLGWLRRTRVGPGVERGPATRVRSSVLEAGCRLGPGCEIERSLLLPGARLGADCRLERSIVAPGLTLPTGTSVANRMVTAERSGAPPAEADSVVGGLVYSRLTPGRQ